MSSSLYPSNRLRAFLCVCSARLLSSLPRCALRCACVVCVDGRQAPSTMGFFFGKAFWSNLIGSRITYRFQRHVWPITGIYPRSNFDAISGVLVGRLVDTRGDSHRKQKLRKPKNHTAVGWRMSMRSDLSHCCLAAHDCARHGIRR